MAILENKRTILEAQMSNIIQVLPVCWLFGENGGLAEAYSEARIRQNQASPRSSFTRLPSLADAADSSRSAHATDPSRGWLNQVCSKVLRCALSKHANKNSGTSRSLYCQNLSLLRPVAPKKNVEKPTRTKIGKSWSRKSVFIFLAGILMS